MYCLDGSPVKGVIGDCRILLALPTLLPGSYVSICLEFKVLSFPLNALLKSSDLDASESLGFNNALGAGEEYLTLENESSDEANTCGEAFAILRQLVERWVQDCADENNQLPILLTRNLQRWLQKSVPYI